MLGICSNNMFVSVVIPTYDEEENIVECLESILRQTELPDEVIIIDDGSTDRTVELINEIGSKLIKVVSVEHRGVSFARHFGVSQTAESDATHIITTTDADVVFPSDHIKKIKEHFALDDGLVAVCGGCVDKYNRPMESLMSSISSVVFKGLGGNTAYLKSAYFRTTGYDVSMPHGSGSDVKFWEEVGKVGRTRYDKDMRVMHKSGYRWRAIPVYTVAIINVATGLTIRKRNEVIGDSLAGVGLGIGVGELGHHILNDCEECKHHDFTGLAGLGITFLLDKTNIITNKRLVNTGYGVFFGLLAHHLMTEGCSL